MTPESEIRATAEKGRRAKGLIENPILVEAFAAVDAACVKAWRESPDPEIRENAWHRTQALGLVKAALAAAIKKGEDAQRKLAAKPTI